MRNKTLITIICITIIIVLSGSVAAHSQNESYGYEVVNSTKDEEYESTNVSTEIEKTVENTKEYNENTGTLLKEANNNINKYSDKINEVINVTNQYRNEVGLKNLTVDKNLSTAASVRALEMAYTQKLSHTRPDGAYCFRVLRDLGIRYNYAGENIGDGFKQSEGVCQAWKDSPSHYKNIVNGRYTKIGVGVAQSVDGRYYWVQIFSN